MLDELYIENFVLFERATLEFAPGLNVISGETGAGKSLVAQALSLALGQRAGADVIRTGKQEATITAVFTPPAGFLPRLRQLGIEPDATGRLLFSRSLRRRGRGRLTLGGRPVSANLVREAAGHMLDLAAQNEHTLLAESAYQRRLLDAYGGLSAKVRAFGKAFARARSLADRLHASDEQRRRVAARLEELSEKLSLLAALEPDADADAGLEERIRLLGNSEAVLRVCGRGLAELYENDGAVQDVVSSLQREIEGLDAASPGLEGAARSLEQVLVAVGEAVEHLRDAAAEIEAAPGELERLLERAEALKAAARRLDCGVDELAEVQARLQAEQEELAGWGADSGEVERRLTDCLRQTREAGAALSAARAQAAGKLTRAVSRELKELGMEQGTFQVELAPLWSAGDAPAALLQGCTEEGMENVSFLVKPNPGEPASSLQETASGGETSRTMLAIKSALCRVHTPLLLFFDEIDSAIGGRLGDVIGRKLRNLARRSQVIAITHLPQIAARADNHLKVEKNVRDGRTVAGVVRLDDAQRLEEVAQMIHGRAATGITRRQAREMLEQARREA